MIHEVRVLNPKGKKKTDFESGIAAGTLEKVQRPEP